MSQWTLSKVKPFGCRWNSSLQQENTNARTQIAGDKFRAAFLRRKINVLQSKRAKARADLVYRSAKPGHVPCSAERVKGREAETTPERFYLDEIQSKYQGLDPQDAGRKVGSRAPSCGGCRLNTHNCLSFRSATLLSQLL